MTREKSDYTTVVENMDSFFGAFEGKPTRLKKYMELLLLKDGATPYSYIPTSEMRRIALVLTTKCNLKCAWCHRNEPPVQDYLHQEMPYDMALELLGKLKGFETLHWAGLGEPLMHPRLFDLTREARKQFSVVKLTTNGTLLSPEKADELIDSGLNYLEVSIDGFSGDANKTFRGVDEEKILDVLHYISANSSIPIQVNSVISKNNYDALFAAVDRLAGIRNVGVLHTIPLFMTTHMEQQGIEAVSQDEHHRLLKHWKARIASLGSTLKLSPDVWAARLDPVITMKKRHNICFSCYEDPFINVNGALAPCGRLQHVSLTDLNDHEDFASAWNANKMLAWRNSHLDGRFGQDCRRECSMKSIETGENA